jgi:flagellar assembly protein FliH
MAFPRAKADAAEFDFAPLEAPAGMLASNDPDVEAIALLAGARREADVIRAIAHAEGLAGGRDEARSELEPAAAALAQAAAAVNAGSLAAVERLETHAVDLALYLAERVIGAAVAVDPGLVVEAVRGSLRGLVDRERVTVLVHPDDLALVRAAIGDLAAGLGGIEHCEVQAERRVTRGGAIVRTPDGDVDARIETKLQRAREVVEAALGGS